MKISAHADHVPDHLRFKRMHTGCGITDRLKPIRPWIYDLLVLAAIIVCGIAFLIVAPPFMDWLK